MWVTDGGCVPYLALRQVLLEQPSDAILASSILVPLMLAMELLVSTCRMPSLKLELRQVLESIPRELLLLCFWCSLPQRLVLPASPVNDMIVQAM